MWIPMLVVIATLLPAVQQTPSLEGEWVGTYKTAQEQGDFVVKVGRANGEWSVAVKATSSNHPNSEYQSATDVKIEGNSLSFALNWGTRVDVKGTREGDSVSGELTSDHFSGRWTVKRKMD